jgi:type II secretory pathway pseudopilin PulG
MRILVNHDGQQLGPYSLEEVRAALQAGSLNATDLAWVEGTPSWVALSSIVNAPAGSPPAFGGTAPQFGSQPYGQPQGETSGLAITSLVLGILSFLCFSIFASIPGVICGHIARSNIRKSQGRQKGEGLALGGLICGYINIAMVPIMAALMFPMITQGVKKAEEVQVMNDARQIAEGCKQYSNDHGGKYPATLEELAPEFVPTATLHRPGSAGFDYFAAGKSNPAPDTVILAGKKADKKGNRVVARASGLVTSEYFNDGLLGEETSEAPAPKKR